MNTMMQEMVLRECEDLTEMLDYARTILQTHEEWKEYFNNELSKRGLTVNGFRQICGVSYNTVKKWADGILPKTRENFIKIGLGLRYSDVRINYLLNRYGKYSSLYAKSWEDAICIFTIKQYGNDISVNLVKKYMELCLKYTMLFEAPKIMSKGNRVGTSVLVEELDLMQDEAQLDKFMRVHTNEFADSHGKLIDFIENFIATVDERYELQIIGGDVKGADNKYIFTNDRDLAANFGYRRNKRFKTICDTQLSNLRQHRELPTRKNLIILGIYLNMGLEAVNELLSLANMEPLYPKDTVECMLIYALMNIDVSRAEYMMEYAVRLREFGDKNWKAYCDSFLRYYERKYSKDDYDKKIDEVENSVADYVSSVLTDISKEKPEYREYLEEYRDLLRKD